MSITQFVMKTGIVQTVYNNVLYRSSSDKNTISGAALSNGWWHICP